MRQILSLLSFLLLPLSWASGAVPASEQLQMAIDAIERLSPYFVEAEVVYDGETIPVYYEVGDNQYYMSIEQQELYGDSTTRYEVYNSRKEVVVDNASNDNSSLLDNPATVFSALALNFTAQQVDSTAGSITLRLYSNDENSPIDEIEVELSKSSNLPLKLTYFMAGEAVAININKIAALPQQPITQYDSTKYNGYEVIDFR